MSSTPEFVNYLCEQLEGIGAVRSRKMFGEYMIYLNDKPVLLVCDDTPYAKPLDCVSFLEGRPMALPYEGAGREYYVLDPDDREVLQRAALALEEVTPIPKKKAKKKAGTAEVDGPVPWDVMWPKHLQPTMDDIADWVKDSLFLDLRDWMADTYGAAPSIEFSAYSMDRGWNVKYRKGSKSLAACYVRHGWFTAMVTLGAKPMEDLTALLPTFSKYLQDLFAATPRFNGGKWLVIDVKAPEQLEDVKRLVLLKARPKK